jgi:acyl dehydratase
MRPLTPTTTAPFTRVQIARYAGAVGDFNPIHIDDAFAAKAGLPSVIAHGPLTLAVILDAVVAQVGTSSLESFDARLRAPVFPGDQLRVLPSETGLEVRNSNDVVVATVELERKEA